MKVTHNIDVATKQLSALLTQYAQAVNRNIDRAVFEQATELMGDIVTDWPVDTGYSRAAWQGPIKIGEAHYELRNPVVYAAVIEYGGYPGVGPRTVEVSGQQTGSGISINAGIYSRQSIAPVRRALSARILAMKRAILQAATR